jgi:hypothetical protein
MELNTDQIHAVKLNLKFQHFSVLPVRKGIFSVVTVNLVIEYRNYVFPVSSDSVFRIIRYMFRHKLHAIIRPLHNMTTETDVCLIYV